MDLRTPEMKFGNLPDPLRDELRKAGIARLNRFDERGASDGADKWETGPVYCELGQHLVGNMSQTYSFIIMVILTNKRRRWWR